MWTLLLVAGASVLFVMIVWVVVTAIRIVKPESHAQSEADRLRVIRMRRALSGARIHVRFHDIRELERERAHVGEGGEEQMYAWYDGASLGFPLEWHTDLEQRQN